MPPKNSETTFNEALCRVLWRMNPEWRERMAAEQHGALTDAGKPDIVVHNGTTAPVLIESEYQPATTVEQDASHRLGAKLADSGDRIEHCIALRAPRDLRNVPQSTLEDAIRKATFEWCLLSREGDQTSPTRRWPTAGWVAGKVEQLADLIEDASISERIVAAGLHQLETGIRLAAGLLRNRTRERPGVNRDIAAVLRQEDSEQTSRMAMAIIANALTFQTMLAGAHETPTLDQLRVHGALPKVAVIKAWDQILNINYWPIFLVAQEVLRPIPNGTAAKILDELARVASELEAHGVTRSHDLYGRTFQRLIADRKFLATFYTLPSSATLLAELAVSLLDTAWNDAGAVTSLRICDFACGTGTLITAAYRAIAGRHRRRSGDDRKIHRQMMEESIIAADIVPAATHLTTSMLSTAHPTITFGRTQVHLLPYGRQPDEVGEAEARALFALGALDFTNTEHGTGLFEDTGIQVHHGKADAQPVRETGKGHSRTFLLDHQSMDLVIINPPFTRPTNHEATAAPVPSFAGLGTADEEQAAMSNLLRKIRRKTHEPAGHGNAGLASNFLDLAHAKVRPGGTLAMVMPLVLVQGEAWNRGRELLATRYNDLTIVGLAASAGGDKSFSADTGMGEVLVVGRRNTEGHRNDNPKAITFVALRQRPRSIADAAGLAMAIRSSGAPGVSEIRVGAETRGIRSVGSWQNATSVSILHGDLITVAEGLRHGVLTLPQGGGNHRISITTLETLGRRGLLHRDINGRDWIGRAEDGTRRRRGAFDVVPLDEPAPNYPMLWNHATARERCLFVEPDRKGHVREGAELAAEEAWQTATRLHFNLDFQINAQSLTACMTPEPTLGGRAWPNFQANDTRDDAVIALWTNSTLGLLLFWWAGSSQQAGRACLTITRLPRLPVLDTAKLTEQQREEARNLWETVKSRQLLPANEAYRDKVRQQIDEELLTAVVGLPASVLGPLDHVRRQWCLEPTVHGGKKTQPGPTA